MQSTSKGPRLVLQYAPLHRFAFSMCFRQSLRSQILLASTSKWRAANEAASAGIDVVSWKRGFDFQYFVYAPFVFLLASFPHHLQIRPLDTESCMLVVPMEHLCL